MISDYGIDITLWNFLLFLLTSLGIAIGVVLVWRWASDANKKRGVAVAGLVLAMSAPALADTEYAVSYYLRGDVSQATVFFNAGTYEFLKTQNNTTAVYVLARVPNDPVVNMIFLGPYGEVALPATMPAINFPSGTDFAAAVPVNISYGGGGGVIGTPEFSVLRRLPRFPDITGTVKTAKLKLRTGMQYATAWGATGMLKALQKPVTLRGLFIDRYPFTFEIEPWCAGTNMLKLMIAVGLGAAILLRPGWPRAFALVGMAGLIAVEANVFRVAATVLLYEQMGREAWAWKDWIGAAATAFALVQVIGPVAVAIGTRRSRSRF